MTTPDPYPADPNSLDGERTHTAANRSRHETDAGGEDAGGDDAGGQDAGGQAAGGQAKPGQSERSERPGGNVQTDRNGKTYEGNTGVSGETAEDVGA